MEKELIEHLRGFVTERRSGLIDKVLEDRTRYIKIVLENIYQSQNASAVLRSCDCFGVQDVHVIENSYKFDIDPQVTMGSSKWLNIHSHREKENNTLDAIKELKADGYRIIATSPHVKDVTIEELDLNKGKFALFFGTELTGLSDIVMDNADEFVKVPMYGFTESFNISVCASLSLYELTKRLRQSDIDWGLSKTEKDEIKLEWLRRTIKSSDEIVERFMEGKE
ncbi:MAG: RNA methyltransferase [Marinifilaceae bacterium]